MGIALVIAALFNNVWIYFGAVIILTIIIACDAFGLIILPRGTKKKRSIKAEKYEPPDYVMFDDLDDK